MSDNPRSSPVSIVSDDPALNIDPNATVESIDVLPDAEVVDPPPNGRRRTPSPEELVEDAKAVAEISAAHDKLHGDPVPDGMIVSPEEVWLDPLEALLQGPVELPERDLAFRRLRAKFRFRAIPTERYNRIQADYTVRRRDNKTGEIVTTIKDREMKVQVIIESCVNFDFGNKDIWRKFHVGDIHACVERVLLPGEIDQAAIFVRELSGFGFADLEEEAGNS